MQDVAVRGNTAEHAGEAGLLPCRGSYTRRHERGGQGRQPPAVRSMAATRASMASSCAALTGCGSASKLPNSALRTSSR